MTPVLAQPSDASTRTISYSASETIAVPPASSYAGSGGGDGWAVALSSTSVYNVFHHSGSLTVACHLQSNASACWSPETITDSAGHGFATSGQPGLYLDQNTGRLYVYATRTSDNTGGVVCIDTTQAATNTDPFCGFTQLTNVGDAPLLSGISALSGPAQVGSHWYAFNYVNGSGVTGTRNMLLCFDLSVLGPCASQPFTVSLGAGTVSDIDFPSPAPAAIGGQIVIPVSLNSSVYELACFDASTLGSCSGAWPASTSIYSYPESSNSGTGGGAPFPLLTSGGSVAGVCLPVAGDPCFSTSGSPTSTPTGLAGTVPANAGWDGPAITLGSRVYIPSGNFSGTDQVSCFDYSTGTSCANFPKTFTNLSLLYTVNPDPQRPSCIWVDSDGGTAQIQNFDAYTGGGCTQWPVRLLASSLVAPGQSCVPTSYTSLTVQSPLRSTYTSGSVTIEDADGNPLPGLSNLALDANGSLDLSGDNLSSPSGLPQFLITLSGGQTPSSAQVQLAWTGAASSSCQPTGTPGVPESASGLGSAAVMRYPTSPCKARPVDCASGDFWHSFTDVAVPGRGPGLELTRTYNSLAAAKAGIFGNGWSSSYDMQLAVNGDGSVTITAPDGSQVTASPAGGGAFTMPTWADSTLTSANGTYTYTRQAAEKFTFNSNGQLTAVSDLNEFTTSLSYNASGQLQTVTDAAGRTLNFTFGANGLVSKVSDPAGQSTAYSYDGNGNLTGVTDPMGRAWVFTYDANHLLLSMTDPRGGVTTNVYDSSARVTSQTDPAGLVTRFSYAGNNFSSFGGTTTITDPHSNVETEQFVKGLLMSLTKGTGPSGSTWSYTYDTYTYAPTSISDPDGNITTSTYDPSGDMLSRTDGTGKSTTYTYNGLNEPLTITDPTGIVTTYAYDSNGNVLNMTITGAGGSPSLATAYAYGDGTAGDVTQVTDPAGRVTNYSYDSYGDVTSVTTHPSQPLTDTTTAVYDVLGRKVCEASPNATATGVACPAAGSPRVNDTTTWAYDADSEVTSVADRTGATSSYAYDADGNQTQVTDPLGKVTATVYDPDNRKSTVTAGYGSSAAATTSYSYDLSPGSGGCSASVVGVTYCDTATSPLGATTIEYFDAQDRRIEDAPPAPIAPTVDTYDPVGNLATQQTPGGLASYGYDADHRLTSVTYSHAVSGYAPAANVTYSYDPDGHRVSMTDGTGTSTYSYDPLGRLASSTNGAGAAVSYGYDPDGNLTTLTYPGGQAVTRSYDGAGQWTSVTDWQGHTTGFSYDHDGNLVTESLANGLTSTSTFDQADRVISNSDAPLASPSNPVDSITYTRDTSGQLTSEADTTCVGGPCSQSYSYDPLNRITSQGYGSYSYDKGSDLTSWPDGVTQAFNNANQIQSSATPVSTVGYNLYTYNAGVTTVPVSLPSGIEASDQIIVGISETNAQTANTPAGYVPVGTYGSSSAGSQRIQVFRRTASGGETTVTIPFSNNNVSGPTSIAVAVYRGLNPANPVDAVSSTSVQSSNTLTVPSVTASFAGDELMMVTGNSYPTGTTFSAPPGMQTETGMTPGNGNISLDDELLPTAGPTGSEGGSFSGSVKPPSSVGVLLALKPSVTTYTYDNAGERTSNVAPLGTDTLSYDQAGRLVAFDKTAYAYNGDGLRMSKTATGQQAETFAWDLSSSQPMVLQDGSIDYVYGPGGLPLEQIGAPTITLVGTGANDETLTGGAKSSITVNFSIKAAPNDQILVAVTENDTTTASIPGYTFVTEINNVNGATNDKLELWRRTATGGEQSATVSVDKTDHTKAVVAAIYRGVDPSNPVDAFDASFNALASTSVTVPSVSASEANDELVMLQGALDNTSSATWIAPSGMIERQQETTNLVSAAFADQPLPATGATGSRTTSLNLGGSASLSAVVIALRPQTIYYLHDQRGTTRFLTDQTGNPLASYFDGPYGQNPASAGPQALLAANPFRLEGAYTDQESGLNYLINRYYDPTTGQFLNRDPLTAITGQPYAYAGDDPVNYSDPTGLSKCGHPHGIFDTIGSLVDCASSGNLGGAVSTVTQAGTGIVGAGISASPVGIGMQAFSSVTGYSVGGCLGGSATGFSVNVTGSACYYATPSGQSGLTVTYGGGTGLGWGADLTAGPAFSNAQTLNDLGGWFGYTGGSVGEGDVASGSLSYGRNSCGDLITNGYVGVGEDSGLNFAPFFGIPGLPFSAGTGASYTWTYPSW